MNESLKKVFVHQRRHDDAILKLLENTTIGTNGAKYQHLHTAKKINDLFKPHFFTIFRNKKAIANITLCERPIYVKSQAVNTIYVRYFAFDAIFQTKNKTKKRDRSSLFQQYIKALFDTSNLNVFQPEFKPSVFWAIVDPFNDRSWDMANRFGFETIANMKTFAFSRFFPKDNPKVSRLSATEEDLTWHAIQEFYKAHTNLTKVHLFKHNNYFVYKEDNKIVAGIQANKTSWQIKALPGLRGKLLVNLLPYVPLINRIINPKHYEFLSTEGLFWKSGHEDKVRPLLEAVLAQQNCHSLLIWIDSRDKKLECTLKSTKLGLLQRLKNDNPVEILAKFNHFPQDLKANMINSCHYITGFDTT